MAGVSSQTTNKFEPRKLGIRFSPFSFVLFSSSAILGLAATHAMSLSPFMEESWMDHQPKQVQEISFLRAPLLDLNPR